MVAILDHLLLITFQTSVYYSKLVVDWKLCLVPIVRPVKFHVHSVMFLDYAWWVLNLPKVGMANLGFWNLILIPNFFIEKFTFYPGPNHIFWNLCLQTRLLVCPSVNLLMNVPGFHLILLVSYQLVSYLWIALRLRKILILYQDKRSVTLVMVSKLFIFFFSHKV